MLLHTMLYNSYTIKNIINHFWYMKIQKITEFNTSKWIGGTTTELFIYPQTSIYSKRNFLFRLSSATIDLERSEFTDLNGFQRFIAPLEGSLCLSHDEENYKLLAQNKIYAFDGGVKTVSKGKCRDFNLMIKNNYQASIESISLKANNLLKINAIHNQIVWLFSFNNLSEIKISVNSKLFENYKLEQMTFFVFTPENEDDSSSEIVVSTNKQANLFYGKVSLFTCRSTP